MKKNSRVIAIVIASVVILSNNAFAQDTASRDFGNKLRGRPYIGTGVFIPKEGDVNIGAGMTFGFEIAGENEAVFLGATFSQAGKDSSILWASGDVRHTVVSLVGYKTNFGKWEKWMLGAEIQSHRMDFGNRKMSALTVAALAEYRITNKTSIQLVTSQLARKSDVRFGAFQLTVLRYF